MERDDLQDEFTEIWNKLIPVIIDLAKKSNSTTLCQFIGTYECNEVSDGE